MRIFYIVCVTIALLILVIGLQGLIYWGMGAFICWAFNISFQWKFIHGIALAFIVSILAGIFKSDKIN